MPLYAYKCEECENEWEEFKKVDERLNTKCPKCGGKCKIDFSKFGTRNIMFFTPWTYEDLDVYPIHITSKKQLKRECEKRGLKAARLM
ncbi:MAG: hypothetical protein DRN14_03300 [Thermoplasmata archaeon]|nr:MAG: hypothetical protein DRN14_03300 [Thermoplasmata archaeon]